MQLLFGVCMCADTTATALATACSRMIPSTDATSAAVTASCLLFRADAATADQASHSRQVKRMQEEKAKLEENLEEVSTLCGAPVTLCVYQ